MTKADCPSKMVWLEEYKRCGCSFIADKKSDLPGYCPRHFDDFRRRTRILDVGFERGWVGNG